MANGTIHNAEQMGGVGLCESEPIKSVSQFDCGHGGSRVAVRTEPLITIRDAWLAARLTSNVSLSDLAVDFPASLAHGVGRAFGAGASVNSPSTSASAAPRKRCATAARCGRARAERHCGAFRRSWGHALDALNHLDLGGEPFGSDRLLRETRLSQQCRDVFPRVKRSPRR
jgi:hypothetical protein